MRSRGVWIWGIATLLIAASGAGKSHPADAAPRPSARVAILSPGSWCWFGDPRAVEIPGRRNDVIVGWISWSGAVMVAAFAPHFGIVQTQVVGRLSRDDHGSPALFVEPDKRLTVFWSGHNGERMYYRTTLLPEDVSAWGAVRTVHSRHFGAKGFTYPNPVSLSAEDDRLYLFWRGEDWSQDFSTRAASGRWSASRRLIAARGERPYVKVDSNGRDMIALAFTNGHPRETTTSVYYAAYRHGALWTAEGRPIARLAQAPIAPRQAQLVYDGRAHHVSSWVWDVALGSGGHPVIVYATFPQPANHAYWYARWNGREWVSHFLTLAGGTISPGTIERQYSGGIALDHAHPSTLFLSREVDRHFEIERWSTPDGGWHWTHQTVVRNGTDNVRPVVPRGWTRGPMGLLWLRGHYGSYTHYQTSIAYLR